MQKREGGGNAKDRLINAVGCRQGVVVEAAAEDPRCKALPDCRSQDQFFEELLRLPPPVGRCRCLHTYTPFNDASHNRLRSFETLSTFIDCGIKDLKYLAADHESEACLRSAKVCSRVVNYWN